MKNRRLDTVTLDILRAGPIHGQPLSPLTPYLALCVDEGPVTFHVPFEHYRFMNRLKRLRYLVPQGERQGAAAVPDSMREAELNEIGRNVGELLSAIPTLTAELGRAACRDSELVQLRIVISGAELSLIPFEALVSPQGYPGEGLPLALQKSTPITITREVRRGHPRPVKWDRKPNVLFIAASPAGLEVPTREHVLALRCALEPWIKWAPNPSARVAAVKQHLTLLLDASLPEIERACQEQQFTHVHILAHGDHSEGDTDLRYGVILCDPSDKSRKVVVDGQRLAAALTTSRPDGTTPDPPVVVSLATCDSGNVGDVLIPGGSVAHALQAFGIPWVFASQFPLTKRGSVRMTEMLYDGLLSGEDPRQVLRRLRESLHINARHDHDWASIVGYVTTPEGFDDSVNSLWVMHKRALIDQDFDRADLHRESVALEPQGSEKARALREEIAVHLRQAETRLASWEERLPDDGSIARRELRAECLGLQGAMKKRTAELRFASGEPESAWKRDLRNALVFYAEAMGMNWAQGHWQMTQYLSLLAILGEPADEPLWKNAVRWAEEGTRSERSPDDRAWAHGTLAELAMLRQYHRSQSGDRERDVRDVSTVVANHCTQIVHLMGPASFHVYSTRRQFTRYRDWWRVEIFAPIVTAALAALDKAS